MSLFVPTSTMPITAVSVTKGQLYNLDDDEFLSFQFNPETFMWERKTEWGDLSFYGDDSGGERKYLLTKPREFDLSLLYVADPGAPDIAYQTAGDNPLSQNVSAGVSMDFKFIQDVIERWESKRPDKHRPSRIMVILGDRSFSAVIVSSQFKIVEFFSDLSAREALLTLEFREWQL